MTSTGYNIGLGESDRPSSKVLKPPGGGHTNIFGAEPEPVKKSVVRNASSILEGTNTTLVPTNSTEPTSNVPIEAKPAPQQSAQHVRVPPGGFSSKLW